jgi:class 3 adenylate cyclase
MPGGTGHSSGEPLDIRYAKRDGVAIAYATMGNGNRDLVLVPEYFSNLVHDQSLRRLTAFRERLGQNFRLILFDKRGTGISDRGGAGYGTLETRMEDMTAVLDAVGSERAVVYGEHEGGQMAALYAATYPERTEALVLWQFIPAGPGIDSDDWRHGEPFLHRWGTQEGADELLAFGCPTLARDEEYRAWFVNSMRVGASPEIGYELNKMYYDSDVRSILPSIRVPTLVLVRGENGKQGLGDAASLIAGARVVEFPGDDYFPSWLSPTIPDEIDLFVETLGRETGQDSVLATVLFTDLVGSSELAARLGDRGWAELSTRYHEAVRRELKLFRGTEVDTAGDGFFASFEGPARAIHCARAIRDALVGLELEVRAGIHTGECAIVGGKPSGIAVSTGARVASLAAPGEVLVSQTVKDLIAGSGLALEDRGVHELKGVPGEWRLYAAA